MNHKELYGKSIRDGFTKFNLENPHVYNAFENEAFKAINKGRKKISSDMILEYLRWQILLETNDNSFKINNSYSAYFARFFIEKYPAYKDLFNLRKLRSEENGPFISIDDDGQISFL